MLETINEVTKSLHKRFHKLTDCRIDLDVLLGLLSSNKRNQNARFYNYKMESYYISDNASIVDNPLFESAIIKFLQGLYGQLTDDERAELKYLKIT